MARNGQSLAQTSNVYVYSALFNKHMVPPNLVQQLGAAVHALWVGHEEVQQAEFCGAHVDDLVMAHDAVRHRVQFQTMYFNNVVGQLGRTAAQHGFDPSQQFLGREGLGDVIVCSSFQAIYLVLLLGAGSQHDHRHMARALVATQFMRELNAGFAG